ncbi:hypothetical protein Tco_0024985 [Tanacetum coccineum]
MRVLILHLIFTLLGELRTSPRVPAFFDEVEFVIDLDFIQRYSKRFINHALLQIRDVKHTMNSTQLLWEFNLVGNGSYFVYDLKRFPSYVVITVLTIAGSLDTALDLNDLLSRLMDDLRTSELSIAQQIGDRHLRPYNALNGAALMLVW